MVYVYIYLKDDSKVESPIILNSNIYIHNVSCSFHPCLYVRVLLASHCALLFHLFKNLYHPQRLTWNYFIVEIAPSHSFLSKKWISNTVSHQPTKFPSSFFYLLVTAQSCGILFPAFLKGGSFIRIDCSQPSCWSFTALMGLECLLMYLIVPDDQTVYSSSDHERLVLVYI